MPMDKLISIYSNRGRGLSKNNLFYAATVITINKLTNGQISKNMLMFS
jgi:hypothetical protein